ncbi:unnamed protein product [Amoebophrya sp. A25]|nr:unnamed protein product [Amoebophrya sp. A25]|eukprot:GSA25T00026305001.1
MKKSSISAKGPKEQSSSKKTPVAATTSTKTMKVVNKVGNGPGVSKGDSGAPPKTTNDTSAKKASGEADDGILRKQASGGGSVILQKGSATSKCTGVNEVSCAAAMKTLKAVDDASVLSKGQSAPVKAKKMRAKRAVKTEPEDQVGPSPMQIDCSDESSLLDGGKIRESNNQSSSGASTGTSDPPDFPRVPATNLVDPPGYVRSAAERHPVPPLLPGDPGARASDGTDTDPKPGDDPMEVDHDHALSGDLQEVLPDLLDTATGTACPMEVDFEDEVILGQPGADQCAKTGDNLLDCSSFVQIKDDDSDQEDPPAKGPDKPETGPPLGDKLLVEASTSQLSTQASQRSQRERSLQNWSSSVNTTVDSDHPELTVASNASLEAALQMEKHVMLLGAQPCSSRVSPLGAFCGEDGPPLKPSTSAAQEENRDALQVADDPQRDGRSDSLLLSGRLWATTEDRQRDEQPQQVRQRRPEADEGSAPHPAKVRRLQNPGISTSTTCKESDVEMIIVEDDPDELPARKSRESSDTLAAVPTSRPKDTTTSTSQISNERKIAPMSSRLNMHSNSLVVSTKHTHKPNPKQNTTVKSSPSRLPTINEESPLAVTVEGGDPQGSTSKKEDAECTRGRSLAVGESARDREDSSKKLGASLRSVTKSKKSMPSERSQSNKTLHPLAENGLEALHPPLTSFVISDHASAERRLHKDHERFRFLAADHPHLLSMHCGKHTFAQWLDLIMQIDHALSADVVSESAADLFPTRSAVGKPTDLLKKAIKEPRELALMVLYGDLMGQNTVRTRMPEEGDATRSPKFFETTKQVIRAYHHLEEEMCGFLDYFVTGKFLFPIFYQVLVDYKCAHGVKNAAVCLFHSLPHELKVIALRMRYALCHLVHAWRILPEAIHDVLSGKFGSLSENLKENQKGIHHLFLSAVYSILRITASYFDDSGKAASAKRSVMLPEFDKIWPRLMVEQQNWGALASVTQQRTWTAIKEGLKKEPAAMLQFAKQFKYDRMPSFKSEHFCTETWAPFYILEDDEELESELSSSSDSEDESKQVQDKLAQGIIKNDSIISADSAHSTMSVERLPVTAARPLRKQVEKAAHARASASAHAPTRPTLTFAGKGRHMQEKPISEAAASSIEQGFRSQCSYGPTYKSRKQAAAAASGPYVPRSSHPQHVQQEDSDSEDVKRSRAANRGAAMHGLPHFYPPQMGMGMGMGMPWNPYFQTSGAYANMQEEDADELYFKTANGRAMQYGPMAMKCPTTGFPFVEDPLPSHFDESAINPDEEAQIPLASLHLSATIPPVFGMMTKMVNPVVWRKVKRYALVAIGKDAHVPVPVSETRQIAALELLHNKHAIALVKSKESSEGSLKLTTYVDAITLLAINMVTASYDLKVDEVMKDLSCIPWGGIDFKNALREILVILGAASPFADHGISPRFFGLESHSLSRAIKLCDNILAAVVTMSSNVRDYNSESHKKLVELVKKPLDLVLLLCFVAGVGSKKWQTLNDLKEELSAVPDLVEHLSSLDRCSLVSHFAAYLKETPMKAATLDKFQVRDACLQLRQTVARAPKKVLGNGATTSEDPAYPVKKTKMKMKAKKRNHVDEREPAPAKGSGKKAGGAAASGRQTEKHIEFQSKCDAMLCQKTDLTEVPEGICSVHLCHLLKVLVEVLLAVAFVSSCSLSVNINLIPPCSLCGSLSISAIVLLSVQLRTIMLIQPVSSMPPTLTQHLHTRTQRVAKFDQRARLSVTHIGKRGKLRRLRKSSKEEIW